MVFGRTYGPLGGVRPVSGRRYVLNCKGGGGKKCFKILGILIIDRKVRKAMAFGTIKIDNIFVRAHVALGRFRDHGD